MCILPPEKTLFVTEPFPRLQTTSRRMSSDGTSALLFVDTLMYMVFEMEEFISFEPLAAAVTVVVADDAEDDDRADDDEVVADFPIAVL